jgi:hypothetical protein
MALTDEILFSYWLANKKITSINALLLLSMKINNICVTARGNGAGEVRDAWRAG